MISELNQLEFDKVKHLTDSCRNIEVRAVVSGLNPGRIYVDDATNITAALIWIQGQSGFQLIGDAKSIPFRNELHGWMKKNIEPVLLNLHMQSVEIGVSDGEWEEVIHHMSGSRGIAGDIQHVFIPSSVKGWINTISQPACPSPYTSQYENVRVLSIEEALLEEKTLNQSSFLKDKISHFWTTLDDFLKYGFGYITVHNGDIASVCLSAFVADEMHAIDIETIEVYRRRNYGALVVRAYAEECKSRGVHPYWDCSPSNTGSIRLAKSIGLSLDFNYKVYWYDLLT
ncbi:GNAT family N-acetyltransferase [Paenibacillus sp. 7523-1]|uniref:GNAT family N-acetyltransferase n=1 Tax=Paenibacillus sp. 7523-1 TaxID=2022550 RepID=UPI000BA798AE|nr:GNAT family N-acetyltransferase [Paenibacillus sp. 7523-1]PAD29948.1 acyl-CoA thioesterase [Paenibacillus sp. 7523-1]